MKRVVTARFLLCETGCRARTGTVLAKLVNNEIPVRYYWGGTIEIITGCMRRPDMRILPVIFISLMFGCSTHFSTLNREGSSFKVIYEIPEYQAFQIAQSAITTELPGSQITEVAGAIRGYSTSFRFVLDTYTQQVMVFPVSGIASNGRKLNGFYFEVSGTGSSFVQGRAKNVELFETVQSYAEKTGKGVSVVSVEPRAYEGASSRESNEPASRRLEQLQELRSKGLITETEYEAKKKQILDGI